MKKLYFGLLCFILSLSASYAVSTATVLPGEILTLQPTGPNETVNHPETVILAKGGSTIQIQPTADGADFAVAARIQPDGGEVTLNVAGDVSSGTAFLCGGLWSINGGSLRVVGTGKLIFGSQTITGSINYPLLDADIVFAEPDASGLVLTNEVTVSRLPSAACPLRIAPGTTLALWGTNTLARLGVTDTLTLDTWDAYILNDTALPSGATVCVNSGRTLRIKPCERDLADLWHWVGLRDVTLNMNISLGGEGARLLLLSKNNMQLNGSISGVGDLTMKADVNDYSRTFLNGPCTFKGSVRVQGKSDGLIFSQGTPGDASNPVFLSNTARLGFLGPENPKIASLTSTSDYGQVHARSGQIIDIGLCQGSLLFTGDDLSHTNQTSFRIAATVGDSWLRVTQGALFQLLSAETGTVISAEAYQGFQDVIVDVSQLPEETIPAVNICADAILTLKGASSVITSGEGVLRVEKNDDLRVYSGDKTRVTVDGTVRIFDSALTNWQKKVSRWFDAAAEETFTLYENDVCYTNGFPLVRSWADRQKGKSSTYLHNHRSYQYGTNGNISTTDEHREVYPFLVTNGLNGLSYLSMGAYQQAVPAEYSYNGSGKSKATEARRLSFWYGSDDIRVNATPGWESSDAPVFAILVYGSQNGGGAAVLGSTDGKFLRKSGYSGSNPPKTDDPFIAGSGYAFTADGQAIVPQTTHPDGSWQVLSVELDGTTRLNAIGWNRIYSDSGGQNFAEIIFFSEKPTKEEQKNCETYLAEKWGLSDKYNSDYVRSVRVDGDGLLVVDSDVEFSGGFVGTINIAEDQTLRLPAQKLPPDESSVPEENRLAWFDPECPDTLLLGAEPRPLSVSYMFSRDANGPVTNTGSYYLAGLYGENNSGTDRRPWINRTERGNGPARNWIDFKNVYASNDGNTLRTRRMPFDPAQHNDTTAQPITNVRQAFIVVDSSRGGGSIISSGVTFSDSPGKRRLNGTDFTQPIWATTAWGAFTNVVTYLDAFNVNGSTCGFNGRPEVLSFSFPSGGCSPAFFGYYNVATNCEILGEMLFYSSVFTHEQRNRMIDYLSYKWFGRLGDGYNDLGRATLSGSGIVEIENLNGLPTTASSFTGTVKTVQSAFAFTVDAASNPSAAVDARIFSGTLALPESCAVTVTAVPPIRSGTFTLFSAKTLTGASQVTLETIGDWDGRPPRLIRDGQSLCLFVPAVGTLLFLR